jgi:uncharacterized membrane protein YesL
LEDLDKVTKRKVLSILIGVFLFLLKFKQIKDLEKYKENSLSNEKIIIAKIILYSIIFYLIIALVYIFLPDELFDQKIVQIIRLLLITVPFM